MALPFTGPNLTLDIVQGSLFTWGAVWATTDNTVTPVVVTAVSLTGYTPKAYIRTEPGGPLLLDFSSYITLQPSSVTGRIQISIPATVTSNLTLSGFYDIILVASSSTNNIMLCQGAVNLTLANSI